MKVDGEIHPLVQMLLERRRVEGLSHRQLAAKLGVHESYWSFLRHGHRTPGTDLIEGALRAFPDLSYPYVAHLTISKLKVDNSAA